MVTYYLLIYMCLLDAFVQLVVRARLCRLFSNYTSDPFNTGANISKHQRSYLLAVFDGMSGLSFWKHISEKDFPLRKAQYPTSRHRVRRPMLDLDADPDLQLLPDEPAPIPVQTPVAIDWFDSGPHPSREDRPGEHGPGEDGLGEDGDEPEQDIPGEGEITEGEAGEEAEGEVEEEMEEEMEDDNLIQDVIQEDEMVDDDSESMDARYRASTIDDLHNIVDANIVDANIVDTRFERS